MPTVTASPTVASVVADAGTIDWNNVNNVLVANAVFATASGAPPHLGTLISHVIKATGFDFSVIGDSDTIDRITLELVRKADVDSVVLAFAYPVELGVVMGNGFSGLPSYWTGTLTTESVLIRTTSLPSVATLKDSTSGVAVGATFFDADGAMVTASIDAIRLTVDYSTSISPAVNSNCAGNVSIEPRTRGKLSIEPRIKGTVKVE